MKQMPCVDLLYSVFVCLLWLSSAACREYFTEKPPYVDTCKIYEPGFTKCSTRSTQKLMDQVSSNGIPELLASFGSMDPLKLEKVTFKQDNNDVATLSANITDLIITGFSKMIIKESKVSKKDFSWQTKVLLPRLRLDGKYKMAGRILLVPLNGQGNIYIDIDNLDILMHTKTRLYEKGGFTFYNVTNVDVALNMTGLKTNLDNLFNGSNKDVEHSTNELFNENWRDFFEAIRPLITDTVERILLNMLQKLFSLIPANFFVEDIPTSEQLYGKTAPTK